MKELPRFGWRRLWFSFQCAGIGLAQLWRTQQNFRLHLAGAGMVMLLAIVLGVDRRDGVALALAIGLVLTTEALNTAIEFLLDAIAPDHHPLIGLSKDVAAAAVLMSALAAIVVACLVFPVYLEPFCRRFYPW